MASCGGNACGRAQDQALGGGVRADNTVAAVCARGPERCAHGIRNRREVHLGQWQAFHLGACHDRRSVRRGQGDVAGGGGGGQSPSDEIAETSWPEWLVPPLRRVYEEGILMDFHRYPTDDRLSQAAMQCLSHETEMNKMRVSTVADRVSIVRKAHTASNDWLKTKKTLVDLFGLSKVSTVQRWGVVTTHNLIPKSVPPSSTPTFFFQVVAALGRCRHLCVSILYLPYTPTISPDTFDSLPMLAACPHPQSCGFSPQAGGGRPPKLAACPRQCTFCRNSLAFLISLAPRAPLHPPTTTHPTPLEVDHVGA